MANKIKYGLSKLYYAVATDDGTGTLTYATPVAWPGAVSISLDAQGSSDPFHADNVVYWLGNSNTGYEGDLEVALIPDSVKVALLGETLDATGGFYYEKASDTAAEFALLFQFEGDDSATRHCFYRCKASRPAVAGQTKEDTIEPQTETITITAMARISDELVKSRCPADATAYANWFTTVQEPA